MLPIVISMSREITYEFDTELDLCYIKISRAHIYSTKQISPNIIIDLDEDGNIVGIECLQLGLQLPYKKLRDEFGLCKEYEEQIKQYLKW